MPIFHYSGYRPDGSPVKGTLEAEGLQNAVAGVKALGVYPKDVSEYVHKERWWLGLRDGGLLPLITRQLSVLIASGVPLMEALKSLAEENRGRWKAVLVNIKERVSAGASLSRALQEHGKIFPDFYISMVAAGESSGTLDRVLVRISDYLEKQEAIRSKVRAAMVYPTFMICVGFTVLSFLFTFVVPKIVKIFENSKSALPFITVVLIRLSNLFVNYWWLIIAALAGLIFWVRRVRATRGEFIDRLKMKAPGGIVQSLYFARFSRTLAFLLEGGLPAIASLELSARAVGNRVLEARIRAATERVIEGAPLFQSLEGFPSMLVQLVSTGEKSGTLVDTLNRAASSYEEDFERRVRKALALLEPGMILVMGLIVGFVVLAVLLPMFQLNQLVK